MGAPFFLPIASSTPLARTFGEFQRRAVLYEESRMRTNLFRLVLLLIVTGMLEPRAGAQQADQSMPQSMPQPMNHGPAATLEDEIVEHSGSGTSVEPDSSAMPMLMTMRDGWMLMLHGVTFVTAQKQTGPRG